MPTHWPVTVTILTERSQLVLDLHGRSLSLSYSSVHPSDCASYYRCVRLLQLEGDHEQHLLCYLHNMIHSHWQKVKGQNNGVGAHSCCWRNYSLCGYTLQWCYITIQTTFPRTPQLVPSMLRARCFWPFIVVTPTQAATRPTTSGCSLWR